MSSNGSKKVGSGPDKLRKARASNKFHAPLAKTVPPPRRGAGAAVPIDGKGDEGEGDRDAPPRSESTEELPEDQLLDEDDLEEMEPDEVLEDPAASAEKSSSPPAAARVVTGEVSVKEPAPERRPEPVDPYGKTADADPAVISGELGVSSGIISGEPLARSRPREPDAAAAAAAIAGLDDVETVETSFIGAPPAPPEASSSGSLPRARSSQSGPFPAVGAPPQPSSSGPFAAVAPPTPYPRAGTAPLATPTPFPAPEQPPRSRVAAPPPPGSTEAAREASWKEAHPSAQRWARRRRSHGGMAGRRTPHPLRIGAGLLLIGIGIYLLAIFIPAHEPTAARQSSTGQVSDSWRFSDVQHAAAAAFGFGFVALGLLGAARGVTYRRQVETHCRRCQMTVEATRAGLVLKCSSGGHVAGTQMLSVVILSAFVILSLSTIVLLLTASL